MTLLRALYHLPVNEAVEPVDQNLALEEQLYVLAKRLEAAKRGLGFANQLRNPEQKSKHMSLVLTNLNKIRGQLSRVIKAIEQFDRAEAGYEAQSDLDFNIPRQ